MTLTNRAALFVGFDIETAKITPPDANWRDRRPLGITVAALSGAKGGKTYCGRDEVDELGFADQMAQQEASDLVDVFLLARESGRLIVTWNGMGFDWQVLAEESGRWDDCRMLAWDSIDMMYHFFCVKGFPLSLKAAAAGMGVGSKTEGVDGAAAPYMWQQGDRLTVVEYCQQDAVLTRDLAIACEERGGLRWRARSGRPNVLDLPQGWLTVREAWGLPLPDTGWMDKPLDRREFDGWLVNNGD